MVSFKTAPELIILISHSALKISIKLKSYVIKLKNLKKGYYPDANNSGEDQNSVSGYIHNNPYLFI
jgi:hypothetical protein